jgi:hypothetical protein
MQLKCPSCNASFSLEAALAVDAARSALVAALNMPALGGLLAHYLGLFRATGRALAFARVENLLSTLKPMLDEQIVVRNGLTRRCPHALWQQGLERMIEQRDAGRLQLPLKSHGYLLEIVFALAEQAGAKEEKAIEESRRRGDARQQGQQTVDRMLLISRIRGDVQLGLITPDEAIAKLHDIGIGPEALNG